MKKIVPFLAVIMTLLISFVSFQNAHAAETGYIWVDTEKNSIHGREWMDGANVTVTVRDDEFNVAASANGGFVINFGAAYNIDPGDVVTAKHAEETVTHTPRSDFSFDFTQEEYSGEDWQGSRENATISGTAPNDAYVVLWLSALGPGDRGFTRYWDEVAEVQADGQGNWTYTFESRENEPQPFNYTDIHAFLFYDEANETQVRLENLIGEFTLEEGRYIIDSQDELYQIDWNANATFLTRSSDPGGFGLTVVPQSNTISGNGFPYGELEITIERGNQTFTYEYGITTGGGFEIHYDEHRINIAPGDTVTASVGEISIPHEVIDMTITNIDTQNNKVYGTTNHIVTESVEEWHYEDYVYVILAERAGQQGPTRVVEPNSDGTWIADFSVEQICPISGATRDPANVTPETNLWAYQNVGVESPQHPTTYGRTTIASPLALIDLVRSFIVTRLAEFGALTTNISAVLDDPSQTLIFESEDFGRIEFSSFDIDTLLVINPEFLENMGDFVNISYNSEDDTLRTKVDTTTLDFLAGHEAVIHFFDVKEKLDLPDEFSEENIKDYINIRVYEGDELVTDLSEYFDWDNVTYDADEDTLTLPVNHFTEYVLGEAEELPETGSAVIGIVALGLLSLISYSILKRYNILS